MRVRRFFVALVLGVGLCLGPAAGWSADLAGETIQWVVPFKEGGGTDKWARFYAPLLSEALPGQPNVAVINISGGGSTTGANRFARRAGADGLMILGASGSTQFPFLLGDRRVRYDYDDWHVLLGSPSGGVVYVPGDMDVRGGEDIVRLRGRIWVYGSQGATSLDMIPLLAFEMLGLFVKPVFGMKGRSAGRLAFLRGDTTVDFQVTSVYRKSVAPLVAEGRVTPLFSFGALNEKGEFVRDPALPHLPHFAEFYEEAYGKPPSGAAWRAFRTLFAAGFSAQKMVLIPKSTPEALVESYRDAFARIVGAPDFAARGARVLGDYPQLVAGEAEAMKKTATTIEENSRNWVRNWLANRYDARF